MSLFTAKWLVILEYMIFVNTCQTTLDARVRACVFKASYIWWYRFEFRVEQIKRDLEVYWSVVPIPTQEENNI